MHQSTVAPRRPLHLLIVMVLCAGTLMARLAFWTLMEHGHLAAAAAAERQALDVQAPLRGVIYNAQGEPLATNVVMNVVYAIPKEIKDPQRTAALLAPVLGQPEKYLEQRLTLEAGYVQIAARANHALSQKIRNLALPGIALDPVIQRVYPQGSVASQLLGFANMDNQGDDGIEGYYDRLLAGRAGLRSVLKDTAGNDIHITSEPSSPSHDGANLHLSIDRVAQQFAESELQRAVKQHRADGGTAIVMDPHTGYILSMASTPSFDPNHYWKEQDRSLYLQPATTWTYEPGSTFKIITMAAGLDTHVITPQTAFDDTGQFVVGDRVLHNWNMSGFGWETMTQVLQHSANVGAAWVAARLGTDHFYTYLNRFRFGLPTGVDLQGEGRGILPVPGDKNWTVVNLYTNAFGQGLAVTPLQLITAVGAVANHGVLMKPQTVKRIDYGGQIIDRPPVSEGRVISAQTARTLTTMLVQSAVGGEAAQGLVKGYNIAAKTGTASIAVGGQYVQGATIASIVGYAPAYNPKFVALVIIRHPRDTPWGSMAAAPVLHNLFQDLFRYYRIPPSPHAAFK